jgi:4-hydroxy-3-methylbut-2-enyl diphosphate reductase IspH
LFVGIFKLARTFLAWKHREHRETQTESVSPQYQCQLVDDLLNATNSYRSLKLRFTKQTTAQENWLAKVR